MKALVRQAATWSLGACLILGGLVGCGGSGVPEEQAQPAPTPAPTSTAELLERYNEYDNHDNNHIDLNIAVKVAMLGMDMPIDMNMAIDSAGDAAHMTTQMTMSTTGERTEESSEVYSERAGDHFVTYSTSTDDEGNVTWTKDTVEDDAFPQENLLSDAVLKDATFAENEGGYTLTVDANALFNALSDGDETNFDLDSMFEGLGEGWTKDEGGTSVAVYSFDKDCLLTGMTMNYATSLSYAGEDAANVDPSMLTMSVSMDITMKVSGYGTIKAEDVAVPQDVASAAVPADADK